MSNKTITSILLAAGNVLSAVVINNDLVKALTSQQKWIGLTGKALDSAIHQNASLCMLMAEKSESNDAHALVNLMKNLGLGYRKQGLAVWIQLYSPIRFDGDGKIGVLKQDHKDYKGWRTQEAFDNPFWTLDAAEEKIAKELSIGGLKAMIEKFAKEVASANEAGEVTNKAGLVTKRIVGDKTVIQDYTNRLLGISPKPQQVSSNQQQVEQPVQAQVG